MELKQTDPAFSPSNTEKEGCYIMAVLHMVMRYFSNMIRDIRVIANQLKGRSFVYCFLCQGCLEQPGKWYLILWAAAQAKQKEEIE